MVISNTITQDRKCLHASNPMIIDVTFTRTPELVVGMFPTRYHYFNTVHRGQPESTLMVVASKYNITNTITRPAHFLTFISSSEDLSPNTNTYFSQILLTKTVYDKYQTPTYGTSKNNLTQVVITESLPATVSTHNNPKGPDYFSISDKKINLSASVINMEQSDYLMIYSTKTLLETRTICTATFNSSLTRTASYVSLTMRVCESDHTHVIKNIATNTVGNSLLNSDLLISIKSELMLKMRKNQRQTIVTMATLGAGETIQVTAVNIIKKPNLNYISTMKKSKEYLNSEMSFVNATSISNERKPTFSSKLPDFSENNINTSEKLNLNQKIYKKNITELILSESENSEVFTKNNNKLKPSQYSSLVSSQAIITEHLNLERFRPMLNVVAHLIKKQLTNTHKAQLHTQKFNKEKSKTNSAQSHTTLATIKEPIYIPLEQNVKGKPLNTTNAKPTTADLLGKLKINTLHIYPPKMDVLNKCIKHNLTKHSTSLGNKEISMVHKNAFINTGIPIRPGELITASANVIFGRPNIDETVSQTLLAGNRTTITYRHLNSINSFYPSIPTIYSTMLQNSLSNRNEFMIEYASLLKPPPLPVNRQVLLQYPSTFQSQLGRTRTPGKIRFSPITMLQNNPIHDHYSSQSPISLNTEFYNNQILDVFRVPQIFGEIRPATKSYLALSNTFDYSLSHDCSLDSLKPTLSYRKPLGVSTFSVIHQVNFKNDVISHTVNMHARPLTFKRDSENIPYATTVRGHIDSFLMSHVKIPLSDDKVEVQLTTNRKRVFPVQHEDLKPDETDTKFKVRNNILTNYENAQHSVSFKDAKRQSGLSKYTSIYRNEYFSQFNSKLNYSDNSNGKPIRHVYGIPKEKIKKFTEQDQKTENSNESLHFLKLNTTKKRDLNINTASNKWASMIKYLSVTMPKSVQTITSSLMSSKKSIQTGNISKVLLTTAEHFRVEPLTEYSIDSVNSKFVLKTNTSNTSHLFVANERSQLKSKISKDSNSFMLTSNDDLQFKPSFVIPLNSLQYSSVIPVSNADTFSLILIREPHSDSSQNWRDSTLGIKCHTKGCKNNLLKKLRHDIKMLEPSEMLQDEITSVSKRTLEWDTMSVIVENPKTTSPLPSISTHTRKTTEYLNILKPTKTKTVNIRNLSVIKKSLDAKKYISSNHSIAYSSKNYMKKPISISLDKVLTSSRISKQPQGMNRSSVANLSEMSKSLKTSDYLAKPSLTVNSVRLSNKSSLGSTRDEHGYAPSDINSMLLGAVVADSFSTTNYMKKNNSSNGCHPPCRLNKNELCVTYANNTESSSLCECRPSFGRMFPDRPCKPTYTYEMKFQANWAGNNSFKPRDIIKSNLKTETPYINKILLEAADRMVMQSDYRDIFHGVQLRNVFAEEKDKLTVTFLLQLSENSDEEQLNSVFQKYLRQSNFSIGGTGFYTSKNSLHLLEFKDFDECRYENFNDCSIDAHCFNLIGSYTCSCKEGYTDISINALYPGRHCLNNVIGCDICNYNGKCINNSEDKEHQGKTSCKCYSWYAGTKCQVNMKIIIIFLFISGTILSVLLLFFFLIINTKLKGKQGNGKASELCTAPSTVNPSISTEIGRPTFCKNEAKSTLSQGMTSISKKKHIGGQSTYFKPAELKQSLIHSYKASSACNLSDDFNIRSTTKEHGFSHSAADHSAGEDQTERSITLMIPRAKYCLPYIAQNSHLPHYPTRSFMGNTKRSVVHRDDDNVLYRGTTTPRTALVSAGFEVSALVSDKNVLEIPILDEISFIKEAFDEYTHKTSTSNEDANTMTERDLGSTFLLPHTHLYKPDKMLCDFAGLRSS
ncbi:uncharacterized protein LOC119558332 isoform X2 [Drosophila subpulchrella]|uniref:uncharacterized protein LOC119558332 isoform X2 n=1 Tax=Drosophila subpulchrella TaxID=1486046 RepID=UPI0018A1A61D|nr:uncharacterized protein LOC119558332 isoform X2 [Drosophila subpulchrella]